MLEEWRPAWAVISSYWFLIIALIFVLIASRLPRHPRDASKKPDGSAWITVLLAALAVGILTGLGLATMSIGWHIGLTVWSVTATLALLAIIFTA